LTVGITAWLSSHNSQDDTGGLWQSYAVLRLADVAEDMTLPRITASFIVGANVQAEVIAYMLDAQLFC